MTTLDISALQNSGLLSHIHSPIWVSSQNVRNMIGVIVHSWIKSCVVIIKIHVLINKNPCINKKQVSMASKYMYYNHTPHTNPKHREEEAKNNNNNITSRRK